ncbi:hypothetical protein [Kocuria sp.]|uniref:hypothetical protein n=1 Tax=Kocuria sp. TaxID=1871328 RepID=UPI0026DEA6B4|nr:hypothetical protein [Kocuria sp.]MDO5618913.1 hypothetical protein [Kocuria sp.]
MIRRLTLLLVVMAIPVLTALGTQQLARTTAPPALPTDPVTSQTVQDGGDTAPPSPSNSATNGPRSGSVAPVVPGSVDSNGEVTDPGMPSTVEDTGDLPETGTVDR